MIIAHGQKEGRKDNNKKQNEKMTKNNEKKGICVVLFDAII